MRADLALRAVIEQEAIAATDEELDVEIGRLAERMEEKPAKVRRDLERQGALEAVRSDIARGKALELLVERATVVDEEGNPVDLAPPETSEEALDNNGAADTGDEPVTTEASSQEEPES